MPEISTSTSPSRKRKPESILDQGCQGSKSPRMTVIDSKPVMTRSRTAKVLQLKKWISFCTKTTYSLWHLVVPKYCDFFANFDLKSLMSQCSKEHGKCGLYYLYFQIFKFYKKKYRFFSIFSWNHLEIKIAGKSCSTAVFCHE